MKKLLAMFALIFVGTAGWRIGESLSSDAVSMAIGLLLGVMAGVPTALIVLAAHRREESYTQPQNVPQRLATPVTETHNHYYIGDLSNGTKEVGAHEWQPPALPRHTREAHQVIVSNQGAERRL